MRRYELLVYGQYRVFSYLADDGSNEILDFLDQRNDLNSEEKNERRSMTARLERIADGYILPSDICHLVNNKPKIMQIRTNLHRLLWFYDEGHIIICTNVFCKKTEGATPPREIKRACQLRDEYFEAKETGQLKLIEEEE